MASFAAGVTIVATLDAEGNPQAMTATAFSSVSVEPPLCLVCIDRRSRTYVPLLTQGCFAVSILSAEQEAISARFAAPVADRFAGIRWRSAELTGCPVILGALARNNNNGTKSIKAPLTIQDGFLLIGPVKLLPVPPIDW